MQSTRGQAELGIRVLALLCLIVFLITSLAASIHHHDSEQQGACVICHVAGQANVVDIDSQAGKPPRTFSDDAPFRQYISQDLESPSRDSSPRAPPSQL